MLARIFLLSVLLVASAYAINLVSPEVTDLQDGDTIDLGTIGPGQTVEILINREVTAGGKFGSGGFYDLAYALNLPEGWTSKESKLYQDPLQVTVTAPRDAAEGNYTFRVTVEDERNGEELGNVTFIVKMKITYDVMDFDVSPRYVTVGPGQPARFAISLTNKGSTSDVFEVSSEGAKRWEFRRPVFLSAGESKIFYYEIAAGEEEVYQPTIRVVSHSSDIISDEKNVTIFIRSGLVGDYKATNNGVPIFPIFETAMYAIAGLISNLF